MDPHTALILAGAITAVLGLGGPIPLVFWTGVALIAVGVMWQAFAEDFDSE